MALSKKQESENRTNPTGGAGAYLFTRDVPLQGFELRDDVRFVPYPGDERREPGGPWVVERVPFATERGTKHAAPLGVPDLHVVFAGLDGARDEQVMAFANEWGFLRRPYHVLRPGEGPRQSYPAEPLTLWRYEARQMRTLVDLWDDASGAGNLGEPVDADLRGRIVWEPGPPLQVSLVWPERYGGAIIARESAPAINADALTYWTASGATLDGLPLAEPARFWVCQQVNAALAGAASPQVSPWTKGELAIVPHDLRAALYVLFADRISGRTAGLRACEYCQRFFVPKRSQQKYCGPSCKKRHHYHAHKAAEEGKS